MKSEYLLWEDGFCAGCFQIFCTSLNLNFMIVTITHEIPESKLVKNYNLDDSLTSQKILINAQR
jgi:hypothetical protein